MFILNLSSLDSLLFVVNKVPVSAVITYLSRTKVNGNFRSYDCAGLKHGCILACLLARCVLSVTFFNSLSVTVFSFLNIPGVFLPKNYIDFIYIFVVSIVMHAALASAPRTFDTVLTLIKN